jgi:hypothetical protein
MSFRGPPSGGGSHFDHEMFDEREQELERVAEVHREQTEGEPPQSKRGRLIDRVRTALRRHDSN